MDDQLFLQSAFDLELASTQSLRAPTNLNAADRCSTSDCRYKCNRQTVWIGDRSGIRNLSKPRIEAVAIECGRKDSAIPRGDRHPGYQRRFELLLDSRLWRAELQPDGVAFGGSSTSIRQS